MKLRISDRVYGESNFKIRRKTTNYSTINYLSGKMCGYSRLTIYSVSKKELGQPHVIHKTVQTDETPGASSKANSILYNLMWKTSYYI